MLGKKTPTVIGTQQRRPVTGDRPKDRRRGVDITPEQRRTIVTKKTEKVIDTQRRRVVDERRPYVGIRWPKIGILPILLPVPIPIPIRREAGVDPIHLDLDLDRTLDQTLDRTRDRTRP